MEKMARYISFCVISFLILPLVITSVFKSAAKVKTGAAGEESALYGTGDVILLSEEGDITLEAYIIGVVAAEMPASYKEEALKAQAVAARTYAVKYWENQKTGLNIQNIGQAYCSIEVLKERWGDNFAAYYNKISLAVQATQGEIIKYEGEPIDAVFHAFSAGKTENAEDVWVSERPYLKSVDSGFDENAADFTYRHEFTGNDFYTLLHDEYEDIAFTSGDIINQIVINTYTDAGYVKSVTVGNKTMDGVTLRRILGLRSSNFKAYREGELIIFETKGYGHGAGMSQAGANYLAENGYNYKDILTYYYSGVYIDAY